MTRKTLLVSISMFVGLSVITGCMSLEERLASNDPTIKRNAEYELVTNSRQTGSETDRIAAIKRVTNTDLLMEIALTAQSEQKKKHGSVPSTIPDGMTAVTKLTDQKALSKIAAKANAEEIRVAAIQKLTDQNILLELYKDSYGTTFRQYILPRLDGTSLATISYTTNMIPYWKQISDQRVLAKIYRDGHQTLGESDRQAILDKLADEKILEEMVTPPSSWNATGVDSRKHQMLNHNLRYAETKMDSQIKEAEAAEKRLSFTSAKKHRAKAKDLKVEIKRLKVELDSLESAGSEVLYVGNQEGFNVSNHVALVKKLPHDCICKLLNCKSSGGAFILNQAADRLLLMKMLPENKMVEIALEDIKRHDVYKWNRGDLVALETGMGVAASVKDRNSAVKIVVMVLAHITQYYKKCTEPFSMMAWDKSDKMKVEKILAELPLSESEIGTVICIIPSAWKYLIDRVSAECAYNILLRGKVSTDELEVALVKKLPQLKVDMKVFASVKTDAGKKAVITAMPEEVKKVARETEEKAFAAVLEKAKIAAKDTFELQGFYLGMDWDDMKVVLAHHFPELEIKEGRDGESKDADYIINLPNQRSPFCYASVKDKKIYQFNFGKKMLKKWYSYNASTVMKWAKAYASEHGIDMELVFLNRDDEVYVPDSMLQLTPYSVSLHQETYQNKNVMKNYRLIYYGEPKINAFGGGPMIRALANDKYSAISADAGTLRAEIDND